MRNDGAIEPRLNELCAEQGPCLPQLAVGARRLTITFLRDIRTAPRDRVTVVIIGSSSGVSPTARATENISDWIRGLPKAMLAAQDADNQNRGRARHKQSQLPQVVLERRNLDRSTQ